MTGLQRLSLLHWNLHGLPFTRRWKQRCAAVAQSVSELPRTPDVLLFCEVWTWPRWRVLSQALWPTFEPLSPPRSNGLLPPGGMVAFRFSGSPWARIRDHFEPFRHRGPWWRLWEGDGFAGKGTRRLILESEGLCVGLMQTHLQAQYGRRRYTVVRDAQLKHLTASGRQLARETTIVVIAGDLNTRPTEQNFARNLTEWMDLTESLRLARTATTIAGKPSEWIDYILVHQSAAPLIARTSVQLLSASSANGRISDHHGLYTLITLLQQPREACGSARPIPQQGTLGASVANRQK
ncbi:MAG: endonuclease/exonuclease/phosphatase family protein [Candidatus Binatia bacterium]|nr:endonuclease/exonuclease/phosphatase family protein [Candidatus Binatia bacterium]